MAEQITRDGIATPVGAPYDQALRRTRQALSNEGCGVLTEIDIAATVTRNRDATLRPGAPRARAGRGRSNLLALV